MKTIGITGGVGAGKSLVLNYIKEHYSAKIYFADEIANELKLPGHACYDELVAMLGEGILCEDKTINKSRMAERIFSDSLLLQRVNQIVHPAVKAYILKEIEKECKKGELSFFVLEAALLIEEHYDEILDELWYIHTDEAIRRRRLKEGRGYTDEKTDGIIRSQLSEKEFRRHCRIVIVNNTRPEDMYRQIDEAMNRKL